MFECLMPSQLLVREYFLTVYYYTVTVKHQENDNKVVTSMCGSKSVTLMAHFTQNLNIILCIIKSLVAKPLLTNVSITNKHSNTPTFVHTLMLHICTYSSYYEPLATFILTFCPRLPSPTSPFSPFAPSIPCGPISPLGPCGPVPFPLPFSPGGPISPFSPGLPSAPGGPCSPLIPTGPVTKLL